MTGRGCGAEEVAAVAVVEEVAAVAAARALLAGLRAEGLRDLVICPGSRSAPLVYAAAEAEARGELRTAVRVDERSAGFVALGLALAAPGRPAAVATTSGTAAANLSPAVLEAAHAGVPLLALTADRPAELHGVGANQTADQRGLFGPAVRLELDLPAPGAGPDGGAAPGSDPGSWREAGRRAARAALGRDSAWPGPVHLNLAFREPLVPTAPWAPGVVGADRAARADGTDLAERAVGDERAAPGAIVLEPGPRTVVVAGAGAGPGARALAEGAGWPLFAEPASGAWEGPNAVPAYRLALAEATGPGAMIERAVVFGRPTLSRPVTRLVSRGDVEVVIVHPGGGPWFDVGHNAARVAAAVAAPGAAGSPTAAEAAWLDAWLAAGRAAWAVASGPTGGGLTGPAVAAAVARAGARDATPLFVAASNAVRDLDLAPAPARGAAPVHSNRGLAGIDGTLSSAAGLALGLGRPVRALVGDLAFLHDAGGLAIGAREPVPDLQIVVLHDGGGAIFAGLEPGAPGREAAFERYFATPHTLDVAALAKAHGARSARAETRGELDALLGTAIVGLSVVDVPIPWGR